MRIFKNKNQVRGYKKSYLNCKTNFLKYLVTFVQSCTIINLKNSKLQEPPLKTNFATIVIIFKFLSIEYIFNF